jgi:hypothetical protein
MKNNQDNLNLTLFETIDKTGKIINLDIDGIADSIIKAYSDVLLTVVDYKEILRHTGFDEISPLLEKKIHVLKNGENHSDEISHQIIIPNSGNDSITTFNDNNYNCIDTKLYGPSYLLTYIIKDIGLYDILESTFPLEIDKIITLIHFNIIEKRNLMYCDDFAKLYFTSAKPVEVTSQRISELLSNISGNEINQFYKKWISHIQEIDYCAFDISNAGTYSFNNPMAEYGKLKPTKSNKYLKQINFSLLYGQTSGLPVIGDSYSGNINDVSLLVESMLRIDLLADIVFRLVLDCGFYSKNNLLFMLNHTPRIPFLIGLPGTTSLQQTTTFNRSKSTYFHGP